MFAIEGWQDINLENLFDQSEAERHLQREIISPLEASLDHLLVTPPSHFKLQKVSGWVEGFALATRSDND